MVMLFKNFVAIFLLIFLCYANKQRTRSNLIFIRLKNILFENFHSTEIYITKKNRLHNLTLRETLINLMNSQSKSFKKPFFCDSVTKCYVLLAILSMNHLKTFFPLFSPRQFILVL